MFKNLETLDVKNHKDLRFAPANDFSFAADLASAPLSASEVVEAARAFPIVFTTEGRLLPMALMSVEEGKNVFIDEKGYWHATYVPAHIRRYPFILGNTDTPENFTVLFAPDAPHFNGDNEGSQPLFTQDGENSETLTKVIEFLTTFQNEITATENLIKPLVETGVLTTQQVELTNAKGKNTTIAGIRAVDREKLIEQDDATLAGWVRNGLMVIIDAHLSSIKNIGIIVNRQGIS